MPKQTTKSFQISSNFTLLLSIAIPIFWTVFFGGFTIAALTTHMYEAFPIAASTFKTLTSLFFVLGVSLLYFTLWKLKRVEFSPDSFYVSNYFKHYRYGYAMIESISYINLLLVKVMIIKLTQKGHFGQKLPLIISRKRHQIFIETLPEIAESIGLK